MPTVKSIRTVSLNTFLCNGDILVYDIRVKILNILPFLVLAFLPPRVCRWLLWHLITLNDTHTHTHSHTHWVRLLWTRDRPVAEKSTWQKTTTSQEREIHAPRGIWTRNSRKPTAADPRVRSCGHWDRLLNIVCVKYMLQVLLGYCVLKNT